MHSCPFIKVSARSETNSTSSTKTISASSEMDPPTCRYHDAENPQVLIGSILELILQLFSHTT